MTNPKEILMGLPSQLEIADALMACRPWPRAHETVRRMAIALDLLRDGGWEFVEKTEPDPLRIDKKIPRIPL